MSVNKIDISEATESLAEYAKQVDSGQGPVVVMSDGRPVAAVLAINEDDLDGILLSQNSRFLEILRESKESIEKDGGISSSEMRRRLGVPRRSSSR